MSKLLIYTCTSGHYTDYTALWEYCITRAYPEYDYKSEEIEEPKTSCFAACYRLFNQPSPLYDYIYVTDVDMMILREEPSLLDFHLEEMKQTGLCYSNSPRTREYLGSSRMTGLHFASMEWYEKTLEDRSAHLRLLTKGKIGSDAVDDEICLMNICRNSKVGLPDPRPLVRRHHGIHLGTLRHYMQPKHTKAIRNQQLKLRISSEQAKQWLTYYDDPKFVKIVEAVSKKNKVIKNELETLYSFCRRQEKM